MQRRTFLSAVGLVADQGNSPAAALPIAKDYSDVRGFMYEPSYAWTETEAWQNFDAAVIDLELARGKKFFPGMNAVRMCVSIEAFRRSPEKLESNFARLLDLVAKHRLMLLPMLFNRWHNKLLDFGGIYVDDFFTVKPPQWFDGYVKRVVGKFGNDQRILMWDICNEPFPLYLRSSSEIAQSELDWLTNVYRTAKSLSPKAPLCVGIRGNEGVQAMERVEAISDVLTWHAYYHPGGDKQRFERRILDDYIALGKKVGKPLLVTESCWGADTDQQRVADIAFALGEMKKRRLGFFAVMLHWSYRMDCHGPDSGLPVGNMGDLSFILRDGSLRNGHGVFNEY